MLKTCNACKQTLSVSEFYKGSPKSRSKFTPECKKCSVKRASKYYRKNKDTTYLANRLKRDFNLSIERFKEMLALQNNSCKICLVDQNTTRLKTLVVDHCHTSGEVRGLLCDTCNRAIGLLKDNPAVVKSAHDYLMAVRVTANATENFKK